MERFEVETHPNEDYATIHVAHRLPRTFEFQAERRRGWALSEEKLSEADTEFYVAVASVPGVVEIDARDYHLRIKKGRVFAWDEIIPRIRALLARRFGETAE